MHLGHCLVAVAVVAVVFATVSQGHTDRLTAVLVGAGALLAIGMLLGFYDLNMALAAVKVRTLSLLLGMGLLSAVLDETGFFARAAKHLSRFTAQSATKTLVVFCLITYLFSLFVNNLTTILVVVPMTMRLSERMQIDPRPLIIAEIISSNLGGASSMVGDFPNMLISAEVGLPFTSFVHYMMPPCLVNLGVLLFVLRHAAGATLAGDTAVAAGEIAVAVKMQPIVARRALVVLGATVTAFAFSEEIGVSPAVVALTAGVGLLLFGGADRIAVVKSVGYRDLAFFTSLFVLVGGVHASGALELVAHGIDIISGGEQLVQCLLLMWLAALVTAVLNAGPSTALFLPIFVALRPGPPHHLLWWALSLGVCAGSSATLTGATAGPVAASIVERYRSRSCASTWMGKALGAREYARIGVPIALLFLVISSLYIVAVRFS